MKITKKYCTDSQNASFSHYVEARTETCASRKSIIKTANAYKIVIGMRTDCLRESRIPLIDYPEGIIQSSFSKVKYKWHDMQPFADDCMGSLTNWGMLQEKATDKDNVTSLGHDLPTILPLMFEEEEDEGDSDEEEEEERMGKIRKNVLSTVLKQKFRGRKF